MQPRPKEPKTPPNIEATQFVPDPAPDALYREAAAVARKYGRSVPSRAEFEARYKQEMAGKVQQ